MPCSCTTLVVKEEVVKAKEPRRLHLSSSRWRPRYLSGRGASLGHGRVEVGIWNSVCFNNRKGPPDGGGVGDVGRCHHASTAFEEATVVAKAVGDDGPGISNCGEDP